MTQEEIIEMLRASCDKDKVDPEQNGFWVIVTEELVRFANSVAQHEREACIVDIQMHIPRSGHNTPEMLFAKKVMERIRAREQA